MNKQIEQVVKHFMGSGWRYVASIKELLVNICNDDSYFDTTEEQHEFQQHCSNFDKYCENYMIDQFNRAEFFKHWERVVRSPIMPTLKASDEAVREAAAKVSEKHRPALDKLAELEDIPDLLPKVEYALEIDYDRTGQYRKLIYVPMNSVPPVYHEGMSIEVNDECFSVKTTVVSVQQLDNGMIKITHQVRVR
jgi:hypothetical protein